MTDAPPEVLEAGERAFSHGPIIFAEGQDKGEVVAGDPARLSLVAFAALQGLITISTDGKFKGVSLEILVPEVIERIILGLRPKAERSERTIFRPSNQQNPTGAMVPAEEGSKNRKL